MVLLECRPDEFQSVWIEMAFARLLEFEVDVLMTALAEVLKNTPQTEYGVN